MGADGPQADERAMAADAHPIARVPCEEFLFFVFLANALKKNKVCPVVEKRFRQILKRVFLFEQSFMYCTFDLNWHPGPCKPRILLSPQLE